MVIIFFVVTLILFAHTRSGSAALAGWTDECASGSDGKQISSRLLVVLLLLFALAVNPDAMTMCEQIEWICPFSRFPFASLPLLLSPHLLLGAINLP